MHQYRFQGLELPLAQAERVRKIEEREKQRANGDKTLRISAFRDGSGIQHSDSAVGYLSEYNRKPLIFGFKLQDI